MMLHSTTRRTRRLRRTLVLAALFGATAAHAQDKAACVRAYEESQPLRKEGQLTAARERLLVCAQSACPAVVRKDCAVWLAEVEQATPTVILAARDPQGRDATAVEVALDGAPFADHLDGKPVPLDPGPHTFRFAIAGAAPQEETIVLREGERRRQVLADFRPPAPAPVPPTVAARDAAFPPPSRPAPTPPGAYVLGGLGLAGFGVFATFGLLGLDAKNELDHRACKPTCPAADVDAAKQKLLIADVGLAVGIVSIAAASLVYLTRGEVSETPRSALRIDGGPITGGAALHVAGSF